MARKDSLTEVGRVHGNQPLIFYCSFAVVADRRFIPLRDQLFFGQRGGFVAGFHIGRRHFIRILFAVSTAINPFSLCSLKTWLFFQLRVLFITDFSPRPRRVYMCLVTDDWPDRR